jgi:hypothetical protein
MHDSSITVAIGNSADSSINVSGLWLSEAEPEIAGST